MKQNNSNQQVQRQGNASLATVALLCLSYTLLCIYPSLLIHTVSGEWLSAVLGLSACAVAVFALFKIAGSFKPISGFVFIAGLFLLFGNAIFPVALFVSLVAAACIYAWLLLKGGAPFALATPAIPLVICAAVTRNAVLSAMSLIPLLCALCLAYAVKTKKGRVGATCVISAGICLAVASAFVYAAYSLSGEISAAAIRSMIDYGKIQLTAAVNNVLAEMNNMLGTGLDVTNMAEVMVSSTFNLLPAIIIVVANVFAYIMHSLFLSVCYVTDDDRKQALDLFKFDMSLTSAIVYVSALVLAAVLSSGSSALFGAAAENLVLVLAPGLVLTALAGIRALTVKKASCLSTLLYFGIIFMLASFSMVVISLVALVGAAFIIVAHISRSKKAK